MGEHGGHALQGSSRRSRLRRPFCFGLALGGGAARGLAHIGVLKVLERAGFRPEVLVGTSAGALIGAAFVCLQSSAAVEERFVAYASGDRFRKSRLGMFRRKGRKTFFQQLTHLLKQGLILGVTSARPSFVSEQTFRQDLDELLPDRDIEDLPIPYAAVATNVATGAEVVLRRGPLKRAVAASCALPGVLPPVDADGQTLIDGGSVNKVPSAPARRLGADIVVAVDIHAALPEQPSFTRGIDIVSRAHEITGHALRHHLLKEADVIVRPEVGHIHWADFGRYAEIIRLGEEAATAKLPEIRRAVRRARIRARLMPWTRPVPDLKGASAAATPVAEAAAPRTPSPVTASVAGASPRVGR